MANMASACAFVVSNENTFNSGRPWSTKTAATTCLIVSVAVVSICVMAICGVFIVREYSLSASYKKTKCWVSNITYTDIRPCTYCTQKHKTVSICSPSYFPCVRITVAYEYGGGIREGLLHSDSIEAAGLFSQCSHHVCLGEFATNQAAIEQYVEKWKNLMLSHIHHSMRNHASGSNQRSQGNKLEAIINKYFTLSVPDLTATASPDSAAATAGDGAGDVEGGDGDGGEEDDESNGGIKESIGEKTIDSSSAPTAPSSVIPLAILKRIENIIENRTYARSSDSSNFKCFYNQLRPYDVIETKTYTKWDAIHSMLWPGLVVVVCCCLFLYIETQRRQLTCCGRQPIKYVVEKKKKHHHHHHQHHHQYHQPSDQPDREENEEMALNSMVVKDNDVGYEGEGGDDGKNPSSNDDSNHFAKHSEKTGASNDFNSRYSDKV